MTLALKDWAYVDVVAPDDGFVNYLVNKLGSKYFFHKRYNDFMFPSVIPFYIGKGREDLVTYWHGMVGTNNVLKKFHPSKNYSSIDVVEMGLVRDVYFKNDKPVFRNFSKSLDDFLDEPNLFNSFVKDDGLLLKLVNNVLGLNNNLCDLGISHEDLVTLNVLVQRIKLSSDDVVYHPVIIDFWNSVKSEDFNHDFVRMSSLFIDDTVNILAKYGKRPISSKNKNLIFSFIEEISDLTDTIVF